VASQQVVSLIVPNGTRHECAAIATNISLKGAFLICDRRITPGLKIDMSLLLPPEITCAESKRVCCETKVLRVSQHWQEGHFGAAVEFEQYRLP
jgi:hypothetical protein